MSYVRFIFKLAINIEFTPKVDIYEDTYQTLKLLFQPDKIKYTQRLLNVCCVH